MMHWLLLAVLACTFVLGGVLIVWVAVVTVATFQSVAPGVDRAVGASACNASGEGNDPGTGAALPVTSTVKFHRYLCRRRLGLMVTWRDEGEAYGEIGSRSTSWRITLIRNPRSAISLRAALRIMDAASTLVRAEHVYYSLVGKPDGFWPRLVCGLRGHDAYQCEDECCDGRWWCWRCTAPLDDSRSGKSDRVTRRAPTPFEETMAEIAALEAQYDYQVLGRSGGMYDNVPKEVWDYVPDNNKRLVLRQVRLAEALPASSVVPVEAGTGSGQGRAAPPAEGQT